MKNSISIILLTLASFVISCTSAQTQSASMKLSAVQFSEKMKLFPDAPVVDVRTPGEFSQGHLVNALNYDWNGTSFDQQISLLDKSKPVFVYCASGNRSASAAAKMRADGFKEVYELDGGIRAWRAADLPETK